MQNAAAAQADTVAAGFALLHQPRRALAIAWTALAADPGNLQARLLEGAACKALGRRAPAIAAFRAVLAADPTRAAVAVNLANALAEDGCLDEAATWLRHALAHRPALLPAHVSLIGVLAMGGDLAALEAACLAALSVDPALVQAHQHLAELLARRGLIDEAHRHREAAWGRQRLFVEPAPQASPRVLVLLSTEDGNIPLRYLLPGQRYTLFKWLIDAVPAEHLEAEAAALPGYDLVLNAVGEPDLPAASFAALARFAALCPRPLLNAPARIAPTRRDRLGTLLARIPDLVVPETRLLGAGAAPPDGAFLFRPIGAHGGDGLRLIADGLAPDRTGYATAFHDFRGPDGAWRKYRAIFVDRRPYPYHLAIADHWLVHYYTAGMEHSPTRRAEEAMFLAAPEAAIGTRAMAALAAIGQRLDLDYAGIDFSVLADGRLLVFEANATMVVHPEAGDGPFAYKNRAVGRILDAFDTMLALRRAHFAARAGQAPQTI